MRYVVSVSGYDFMTSYWCEVCDAFIETCKDDFSDGISMYEFRFESYYNDFKKDYLCKTRNVLFEKLIKL